MVSFQLAEGRAPKGMSACTGGTAGCRNRGAADQQGGERSRSAGTSRLALATDGGGSVAWQRPETLDKKHSATQAKIEQLPASMARTYSNPSRKKPAGGSALDGPTAVIWSEVFLWPMTGPLTVPSQLVRRCSAPASEIPLRRDSTVRCPDRRTKTNVRLRIHSHQGPHQFRGSTWGRRSQSLLEPGKFGRSWDSWET